jgi:IS30 family transposase
MRISHEAIYQALYIQGRGALKRELVSCLRYLLYVAVTRAMKILALNSMVLSIMQRYVDARTSLAGQVR